MLPAYTGPGGKDRDPLIWSLCFETVKTHILFFIPLRAPVLWFGQLHFGGILKNYVFPYQDRRVWLGGLAAWGTVIMVSVSLIKTNNNNNNNTENEVLVIIRGIIVWCS